MAPVGRNGVRILLLARTAIRARAARKTDLRSGTSSTSSGPPPTSTHPAVVCLPVESKVLFPGDFQEVIHQPKDAGRGGGGRGGGGLLEGGCYSSAWFRKGHDSLRQPRPCGSQALPNSVHGQTGRILKLEGTTRLLPSAIMSSGTSTINTAAPPSSPFEGCRPCLPPGVLFRSVGRHSKGRTSGRRRNSLRGARPAR